MACAVVFATTYSLILPAITMEYETASEMSGIYLDDPSGVSDQNTDATTDGFSDSPDVNTADLSDQMDQSDLTDPAGQTDQLDVTGLAGQTDQLSLTDPADQAEQIEFADDIFTNQTPVSQEDTFDDGFAVDEREDNIAEIHLTEGGTADAVTGSSSPAGIISEDFEAAVSAFSQASLEAVSGSTRLKLEFPDPVPADTVLTFRPVETQYFNNYYNGAKQEISREFPDWSDFGYKVTDGKFWQVSVGSGSTETLVTISFPQNEVTTDQIVVVDWSDQNWHVYDPDEVIVERFADDSISEILFETDALRNAATDFGILYLTREEDGILPDDFQDADPVNDDSHVEGWNTDQFDSADDSKVEGWITDQFDSADDSKVEGWITDQFDSADDDKVEGWITDQFDSVDDSKVEGWISNQTDLIDERQVIEGNPAAFEAPGDLSSENLPVDTKQTETENDRIEGFILDETDAEETVESAAADVEETVESAAADPEETETSSDFEEIESYVLDEVNPAEFYNHEEIHEIEAEAETEAFEEAPIESEAETAAFEDAPIESEAESAAVEETRIEPETEVEASQESLEEYEPATETVVEDAEELAAASEWADAVEPATETVWVDVEEPATESLWDSLKEAETEAEVFEDSLKETETETELSEEFPEETEIETESVLEEPEELETEAETEEMIAYPAQSFAYEGEVSVFVTAPEGALPENTSMEVTPVDNDDDIANITGAVTEENTEKTVRRIDAVDITFNSPDGTEIEPLIPVKVRMVTQQRKNDEEIVVVHLDDEGNAEKVDNTSIYQSGEETHYMFESLEKAYSGEEPGEVYAGQTDGTDTENDPETDEALQITEFETEQFSIYAVVYTVDFAYSVNGKTYQFSLPGGGFVSFTDLVEVLGIMEDTNTDENGGEAESETNSAKTQTADGMLDVAVSDAARKFAENVETVEFSNPELVWVGKTDAEITVGKLKEANGLECEYSLGLTEEQIEEINHTEVESGDWALISVQPFTSEEELTVTMKNGDVFTIQVTDAQITTMFISDSGELFEVTVTYSEAANIPDGSTLRVTEFSEEDEEYEYARNSVLADKKARGEWVDLSSFGLAAVDISILNPDGEEIEPEAPVQVDIRIKELPGVEDLSEVADTLAIQHHVEVEDGVVVETVFDGNAEASFRLETDEIVAAEGIAVNPSFVSVEDDTAFGESGWNDDNKFSLSDEVQVSFQTPVFSTFTVSWRNNNQNRSATIHYVDEAGNELMVSNGQPVNDTASTTYYYQNNWGSWTEEYPYNYLIYDVEGYEYAYTYRNVNTIDNRITPILTYRDNRWKYTTGTNTSGDNNTWNNLSSNDDIYVVYKKAETVPEGGTPVPRISGDKPEIPTITKGSVVNHDGTNTLSLSVTGHTSIMEAEKLADVIVVFDMSGSMNDSISGAYINLVNGKYYYNRSNGSDYPNTGWPAYHNGIGDDNKYYHFENEVPYDSTRLAQAKSATNTLAYSLLSRNTQASPDLIRMALVTFSNTAHEINLSTTGSEYFTTDYDTFSDAVSGLSNPNGGTNWEYALKLANEMAVENDRATFVIFVTDGNPTFRQTRGVLNNNGTGALGDNDVTDHYFAYNVYGHGDGDNHGRNFDAALTVAESIVSHNKNFYTIGISNDVTNLTNLTTQSGAGADHSKTATSNDELVEAFNEIAASIIAHLGHSDVRIIDGITELTQTVQKSTLVNFAEDDFIYSKERLATQEEISDSTKIPENAELVNREGIAYVVWNNWDPTSEGCAAAVYNTATGAVEWNMGETFMLEDGYTYQVRFKVWPSQEAYDLLADLNNGKKSYDNLSPEEKAQIKEPTTAGGMYTLKTNSETSYTYREATKSGDTVTPTGEPSEPGSFPDVDPLELTTKPLKVKKQWHNNYAASREPVSSITMELYGVSADGTWSQDFKTITLNATGNWQADDNYISYGLVTYNEETDGDEKIYETGHDFTLRETDDEAHYYELNAGIFRPMFINNVPTILERLDSPPTGMSESAFHYSDGSHHYYRLDGKIYQDTQSDTLLIATNSRRSYMDLKKVVVDESNNPVLDDTEFEYKIKFTVPTGIANYDTLEKYIWFSVYDSVAGRTLSPSEYTCNGVITPAQESSAFSGPEYANYLVAISEQEVTLKVKQGWNVRFLNLPIGTTYSFEETNIPEDYNFVKAEVGGTRWIANMVDGTDQGQAVTMTDLPSNTSGSNSDTDISGTIDFANARYSTTYTNKTLTQHVNILKTTQDGTTPLSGAVFSLYTQSGYADDPKQASKTGLTSGEDGIIDLGVLAIGKYYLVETSAPAGYIPLSAPVEITVKDNEVTYNQSDSSLSQSHNGISYDPSTEIYTLTVTNNAGYELPSTGGPGNRLFYLFGSILIFGAGILLWGRRRTI